MVASELRASVRQLLQRQGVDDEGLTNDLVATLLDSGTPRMTSTTSGATHSLWVDGLVYEWDVHRGAVSYSGVPVVVMSIDSTLLSLWKGMREMVGADRFGLALRKQGRSSVEGEWGVIARGSSFESGFYDLGRLAAASGWGRWQLEAVQLDPPVLQVRVLGCWESMLCESAGEPWGIHFLAGKFAGFGSKLFGTNCWTEVEPSGSGDPTDFRFTVRASDRSLESELDRLLESDAATRADLSVAVRRLRAEVTERERIAVELLQAKTDAEAATRAKSRFLANMSHELRTPLHGILGSLEILADTTLSPDQCQLAGGALDSARSLLSIVGDLLDISKIEAGAYQLVEQDFPPMHVLQGVVDLLGPVAKQHGVGLQVEAAVGSEATRRGDRGRIRQILINLVSNAIKFSRNGTVTVRAEVGEADRVRFKVSDTGLGIPEADLTTIFEAFRQVDDSSTRAHSGVGLGLAISASLAEQLSGTLSVVSELGIGSTFTLDIPLAHVEPPTDRILPALVIPEQFEAHVLVVDDAEVNRTIARAMLTSFGCSIQEARNGVEALELLTTESFDLVLMDVMMPEMDGIQATRRYRARSPESRMPIVAVTANAVVGDREACLAAGMDDYLPKPVRRDVLRRCLARWLSVA